MNQNILWLTQLPPTLADNLCVKKRRRSLDFFLAEHVNASASLPLYRLNGCLCQQTRAECIGVAYFTTFTARTDPRGR